MAQSPMFPLWTDAYLGDTHHLTTLEHGAYFLLLVTAWRSKDGTLPDDDKVLSKYTRLTVEKWRKIRPTIQAFFSIENGVWIQGRLQDERKADFEFRKSQSQKAKARHLKNKETDHADASVRHMPPPSPSPSPIPTSVDIDSSVNNSLSSFSKKNDLGQEEKTNENFTLEIEPKKPSMPEIQMAVSLWNEMARKTGLPEVQKITNARSAKLRARLKDCDGLEGWRAALDRIAENPFFHGENKNGWKADFDFVLQEKSFTKLMEGSYKNGKPKTRTDETRRQLQEWVDSH